jgi:methionyl-tRNA formyltransferase
MVVEEGLDTGAVYDRYETAIGPDDTAAYLRERLAEAGSRLLVDNLVRGLGQPTPQQGEPTYAHKVDPAELHVDWSRPAIELHRLVRVGGAWTTHEGSRLKLWATALDERPGSVAVPAGDGALHLLEVQPEGKRRMPAAAWANGAHWHPGDKLGG